jgi:hypothetical protein
MCCLHSLLMSCLHSLLVYGLQVRAICDAKPKAAGCADCGADWNAGKKWASCNLLDTYSRQCGADPSELLSDAPHGVGPSGVLAECSARCCMQSGPSGHEFQFVSWTFV